MLRWPRALDAWLPLLAAAPALFVSLGDAPLQRAEIYFLDAARGMLESGDWLVPRHRGEPFFDKPALSYWLMAAAMRVLGIAPGSARLVSVLAAFGTLLAVFWVGQQLFGRRAAACGALVLAATPAFLGFGRLAMSDMLLALWSTLAVGLGLRSLRPPRPWWAVPLLGAVLGLGFLTKGPIALLLPGIALLLLVRLHGFRIGLRRGALALALALFALIGLGWFGLVLARLGSEPLAYFFLHENLARFSGQAYHSGRGPLYYLASYAFLGLPWAPLLLLAAFRLRHESGARVLLFWLLSMLVPLSLSRAKLDYYLLPLYPAAALLIGRWLADCEWSALERHWLRGALGLLALLCVAGPLVLLRLPEEWQPAAPTWQALMLTGALGAAALAWSMCEPRPRSALAVVTAVTLLLATGFQGWVLPALWARQPERRVLEEVRREQRPGLRVLACHDPAHVERELLFHLRLIVVQDCDLAAAARSPQPTLLLLHDQEDALLQELPALRVVSRHDFLPAKTWRFLALGQPVPMRHLTVVANTLATGSEDGQGQQSSDDAPAWITQRLTR